MTFMRNHRAAALAVGAALLLLSAAAHADETKIGDLTVSDAWSRAASGNGIVYLTVRNDGAAADRLTGVSTDAAKMSHLHVSKKEGGVETMRPVDGVDIPAHATVMLKPGGFHVMLMGLSQPLKTGTTFPITLTFEKAGATTVKVAVKAAGDFRRPGVHGQDGHGRHEQVRQLAQTRGNSHEQIDSRRGRGRRLLRWCARRLGPCGLWRPGVPGNAHHG